MIFQDVNLFKDEETVRSTGDTINMVAAIQLAIVRKSEI